MRSKIILTHGVVFLLFTFAVCYSQSSNSVSGCLPGTTKARHLTQRLTRAAMRASSYTTSTVGTVRSAPTRSFRTAFRARLG